MLIPSSTYAKSLGEIVPNVRVSDLTNVVHFKVPEAKCALKNASNPPFVSGQEKGHLAMLMRAADEFLGGHSRNIGAHEEIIPRGLDFNA